MSEKIQIACAPDNYYVQHCVVMLNSLFINNPTQSFLIHIVKNGLNQKNQKIIKNYIQKQRHQCKFYSVDENLLNGAPVNLHISIASYYRLLLPAVINKEIDKILYLDCDLIIRADISELWNTNITPHSLGAVEDHVPQEHLNKIGINTTSSYFNAGVLLISLKKWRGENIMEKSIEFIKGNSEKIIYWDQDVLNILFQDNWKKLDHYWNVTHFYYRDILSAEDFKLSQEVYAQLKLSPGILHFSSELKPWHYFNHHPMKQEYYKYLKGTKWSSFRGIGAPPTKVETIKHHIKKFVFNLLRKPLLL